MSEIASLMKKLNLQESYIESMMNKINSICGDSENINPCKFNMTGNGNGNGNGNGI